MAGSAPRRYCRGMSDATSNSEAAAKDEAVENVVERVSSWQHGAEEDQVKSELKEGLAASEVSVPEGEVDRLAEEIHGTKEAPEAPKAE